MKAVLSFLLFSSLAFAEPLELSPGERAFQGEFQITQKRVVELVNAGGQAGRDRLQQLRANGYACTPLNNPNFQCKLFAAPEGKEEIRGLVETKLAGSSLTLGSPKGSPKQIIDGETYQEWSLNQSARFLGVDFAYTRYGIIGGELHKLNLGEPTEHAFIVSEAGELDYVLPLTVRKGKITTDYLIRARYIR